MKKFLLLSIILTIVWNCTEKGKDKIFVLPENYTGYVVVIYNQEDGAEKKYENDKRLYEIPPSGILKTKFESDYGWAGLPQFYYGQPNEGKKIPVITEFDDFSENEINATMLSTGKSYKNIDGTGVVEYITFFVGNKSQVTKASKELQKLHIADLAKD